MRPMLAAMFGALALDPFGARQSRPLRITPANALPAYIPSTTWRRRRLELPTRSAQSVSLERTKRRQGRAS